ncbi:MAG: thioredoxin family protein [Candidatus Aminicenantes bacterium]|nr:thioredoxin family protein [Candidatus Aminicenantes bacterium]
MKIRLFVIFFIFMMVCAFAAAKVETVNKTKILKQEGWQEEYNKYRPDDGLIEALKPSIGDNLRIDVYLAFWCSDSRRNVPAFVKIIEKLGAAGLKVNYFTVERKSSRDVKFFPGVEALKVERVPTFIFYRGGKEIGRIIENPKASLVEDFLEITF